MILDHLIFGKIKLLIVKDLIIPWPFAASDGKEDFGSFLFFEGSDFISSLLQFATFTCQIRCGVVPVSVTGAWRVV